MDIKPLGIRAPGETVKDKVKHHTNKRLLKNKGRKYL